MKTFQRKVWDRGYKVWIDDVTEVAEDVEALRMKKGGVIDPLGILYEAHNLLNNDGKPYWVETGKKGFKVIARSDLPEGEQQCRKCGELVAFEDLDKPTDFYYCDCGNNWMDDEGWMERQNDHADFMRKAQKEEGLEL